MGRKSTRPNALPHLRARKKGSRTWYYYDHGIQPDGSRPETALGSDYLQAVRRWAELEASDAPATTVADLLDAWAKVAYLQLADKTVREYIGAVRRLKAWFGKPFPAPLEDVEPGHVGAYLSDHNNTVLATRDKAVLSAAWNWGRQTGIVNLPNPCSGVKGRKSKDRRYVTDAEFRGVWEAADQVVRDALDLLYLTGANPADMMRWRMTDEVLEFRRGKTDEPVRISITGELATLVADIAARRRAAGVISPFLLANERGRSLTYAALRQRFDKARETAGQTWQLRQLRAKAATDKAESAGLEAAQAQLGHASVTTTEIYVRGRRGKVTGPTR